MTKKKPKKPSSTLGTVNFSPTGKVKIQTEKLSDDKELAEDQIFGRFVNAISIQGRIFKLSDIRIENDLDYTEVEEKDNGNSILWDIELTEIINVRQKLEEANKHLYFRELEKIYNSFSEKDDNKYLVFIIDKDQRPPFPKYKTKEGQDLKDIMSEVLDGVPKFMKEINSNIYMVIPINEYYSYGVVKNPPMIHKPTPPSLRYPSGVLIDPNEMENIVVETVSKKFKYPKESKNKRMLIVYSTQQLFEISDRVKEILKKKNIFDEIWYLHAIPDKAVIQRIL